MDFIKDLLESYKPDMSVLSTIEKMVTRINTALDAKGIKAICVPGGSVAKGTFLSGDFDVDLFVRFDYAYCGENLSDLLESALRNVFKNMERVHGSRDYFQAEEGLNYEVVPVLFVTDPKDALNVTDMSPLHVTWVKENLPKGGADEIRLAKLFCKAQGVYGAESYIGGFSGHVLDILIIHYGSFMSLLEASLSWKPKVIIDVSKTFKSDIDGNIISNFNPSKIEGPMIVVDPVLPERNAAAALREPAFNVFSEAASEFLSDPNPSFFKKPVWSATELKSEHPDSSIIVIDLDPKGDKIDVRGARIVKCLTFIRRAFSKREFKVHDSGWIWDKNGPAKLWLIIKDELLDEIKLIRGPPISMNEGVEKFKESHHVTFEKEGFIYAKDKREYRDVESVTEIFSRSDYIKERANSIITTLF